MAINQTGVAFVILRFFRGSLDFLPTRSRGLLLLLLLLLLHLLLLVLLLLLLLLLPSLLFLSSR
jgi:hypothetical protein